MPRGSSATSRVASPVSAQSAQSTHETTLMVNEGDDTLDPQRAALIQDLAQDNWTRFGGRPNAGQSLLRETVSNDGDRPTSYVSNYVARHTVAALQSWQQTPFRDDPITENEVQRWWANWDPALMHLTLPAFVLHYRNRGGIRIPTERDEAYRRGEEVDVHHSSQPREGRPAQKTRLVGNRPSLLFDPGSKINIVGENTALIELDRSSRLATGNVSQRADRNRLKVNGVGEGSAPCDTTGVFPIACSYGGKVQEDTYAANIAGGCGADLPAILGLDSIQSKKSIVLFEQGHETLIMPGNGPYKVVLSPGAKVMKMEKTISGHLAIPCGEWDARQRADVVVGRGEGNTTSFTIEVPGTDGQPSQIDVERLACQPCGPPPHLRGNAPATPRTPSPTPGAASSSHGNVPQPARVLRRTMDAALVEPPPPPRPATPTPAEPERRQAGEPVRTLEDCLRIRMAQRATANGLGDEEWDDEAMMTTLITSIDAMLDNRFNEELGRRNMSNTQYFNIGDDQETGGR